MVAVNEELINKRKSSYLLLKEVLMVGAINFFRVIVIVVVKLSKFST